MYLDDDDELCSAPEFDKSNINNFYLHRVDLMKRIVPPNRLWGKTPVLGHISMISFIVHSSNLINFTPQKGGDYEFIAELYQKLNPVWIDKILSKSQTGNNHAKRNDLSG
jgi:hypothetical protein